MLFIFDLSRWKHFPMYALKSLGETYDGGPFWMRVSLNRLSHSPSANRLVSEMPRSQCNCMAHRSGRELKMTKAKCPQMVRTALMMCLTHSFVCTALGHSVPVDQQVHPPPKFILRVASLVGPPILFCCFSFLILSLQRLLVEFLEVQ